MPLTDRSAGAPVGTARLSPRGCQPSDGARARAASHWCSSCARGARPARGARGRPARGRLAGCGWQAGRQGARSIRPAPRSLAPSRPARAAPSAWDSRRGLSRLDRSGPARSRLVPWRVQWSRGRQWSGAGAPSRHGSRPRRAAHPRDATLGRGGPGGFARGRAGMDPSTPPPLWGPLLRVGGGRSPVPWRARGGGRSVRQRLRAAQQSLARALEVRETPQTEQRGRAAGRSVGFRTSAFCGETRVNRPRGLWVTKPAPCSRLRSWAMGDQGGAGVR